MLVETEIEIFRGYFCAFPQIRISIEFPNIFDIDSTVIYSSDAAALCSTQEPKRIPISRKLNLVLNLASEQACTYIYIYTVQRGCLQFFSSIRINIYILEVCLPNFIIQTRVDANERMHTRPYYYSS